MRTKSFRAVVIIAAAMALSGATAAQEGYPLTGTWYGDYGTGSQKNDLTVIMKWDGRSVSGTFNPGPNASPIKSAVMDITPGKPAEEGRNSTQGIPPKFHVRIEVDLKNASGASGLVVFEGDLENPVAGNRTISGTWTRGNERGTFRIQRL